MAQQSLPFDLPGPGHRTLREICAERVLPEGSLKLLNAQVEQVYALMRDGEWHKAQAILEAAGGSEGLRRMRSLRGLGFTVDRRSAGGRTFEYRLSSENSDTPKNPSEMTPPTIDIYRDGIGFASLVDRMQQDPALKVVNSARISYDTQKQEFDAKDKKLCSFLWEHGHTSPFRHTFYTFHLKAPLFVFRQAFKYQVGSGWRTYEIDGEAVSLEVFDTMFDTDKGCSWNEVSGRYVTFSDPDFYIPTVFRGNPGHGNKQASLDLPEDFDHEAERSSMESECREALWRYKNRLHRGVAKEIARMTLPQNIYTEAYWTVSLQGVMHFLDQRLKPDAQYEIRALALGVKDLVQDDLDRAGVVL